ncbi:MAG: GNAT family N-acetyltransferase [Candidatus Dadabacteria bacterium]
MSGDILERIIFRPARRDESRAIARLFSVASDGVADYVWTKSMKPGEDMVDAGERRYSDESSLFSYRNCTVAESDGKIAGMMVAFPMDRPYDPATNRETDPVLLPYSKLEQHGSYYISGMALFPEHRGMGIGTKFLEIAEEKAAECNLPKISLIVFEENEGALKLYKRHGFYEIMREPVVPHPLIKYSGMALLMVKDVTPGRGTFPSSPS